MRRLAGAASLCVALVTPSVAMGQVSEIIVIPTGVGPALIPTARVARALVKELNRQAGETKSALYYPPPADMPARRGLKKKARRLLAKAQRSFGVMEYDRVIGKAKKALKIYKKLMKTGGQPTGYVACLHMLAAVAQSEGRDKEAFKLMNDALLQDKRPPDAKRFNEDVQRLHQQVLSESPPTGKVRLSSTPGALVWFNGKLRGAAWGTARKRAGLYLVRFYTPGHIGRQRWFRVKANRVRELGVVLNKDESQEAAILGELRSQVREEIPGRAIQQVALERAAAQIILVTAGKGCSAKRCKVGIYWTKDDLWHRRKRVVFTGSAKAVAKAFLKKKKPVGHGGITAIGPVGPRGCKADRECGFKETCVAGRCKKIQPLSRKWWLWTIIGGAVVVTTIAIAVPLSSPDNPVIEVK